jgi:hypothetical protein
LLQLIEELNVACPDYRFGELVHNLAFLARECGDQQAWHIDDPELVEAARKHLSDWNARLGKAEDDSPPKPVFAKS